MRLTLGSVNSYGTKPRKEAEPGIKSNEEKDGSHYRKEAAPIFLTGDTLAKIKQCPEDKF
jgi:hypothetical protein